MTVRWLPLVMFTPLAVAFVVLYLRSVRDAWRLPDVTLVISVDVSPFVEAMRRTSVTVNEFVAATTRMNEAMRRSGGAFAYLAEQLKEIERDE